MPLKWLGARLRAARLNAAKFLRCGDPNDPREAGFAIDPQFRFWWLGITVAVLLISFGMRVRHCRNLYKLVLKSNWAAPVF